MRTGSWSRDSLFTRLDRSLDYAGTSVATLLAVDDHRAISRDLKREKLVCETGILLYAASAAAAPPAATRQRIDRLARAIAPAARSQALLIAIRLRPAVAAELSAAHLCLTAIGHPDPTFQAELDAVLGASTVHSLERSPWKYLEASWHERLGQRRTLTQTDAAAGMSLLSVGLDAISASRLTLYAFTHSLLYLTDFGRDPAAGSAIEDVARQAAESALVRCLDEDDFDLAAELLLTWPYLRAEPGPIAVFALRVLTRIHDELGFLPSFTLRHGEFLSQPTADRRRYLYAETYHTEFVMGMLTAALLLPGVMSEPAVAKPLPAAGRPGIAEMLGEGIVGVRTPAPNWETDFIGLPEPERDALGPFLASIGLRRAILASDFGAVRGLLETVVDRDLAPTATIDQAAELLGRIARPLPPVKQEPLTIRPGPVRP